MEDIHYIAEQFIKDYQATQADTLTTENLEESSRLVCLVRTKSPQYFVDFKRSGIGPVFSHDIRFAKRIRQSEALQWIDSLLAHGQLTRVKE